MTEREVAHVIAEKAAVAAENSATAADKSTKAVEVSELTNKMLWTDRNIMIIKAAISVIVAVYLYTTFITRIQDKLDVHTGAIDKLQSGQAKMEHKQDRVLYQLGLNPNDDGSHDPPPRVRIEAAGKGG